MLALAVAIALGDLLPQRMGDHRLAEAPTGAKGVCSREGVRLGHFVFVCASAALTALARSDAGPTPQ